MTEPFSIPVQKIRRGGDDAVKARRGTRIRESPRRGVWTSDNELTERGGLRAQHESEYNVENTKDKDHGSDSLLRW